MSAVSHFSMSHLSDAALMRELPRLVVSERTSTAAMLAALAEVDARRLYAPLRYASLFLYCVGELRLAPDVAAKRIRVARAVREFPALLDAIEDGRLNVSAVVLLAPHLTAANFDELVAATARQPKEDLRAILAQRFPRPCAMDMEPPLGTAGARPTLAPTVTEASQEQDPDPVAPSDARDSTLPMGPLSSPAAPAPLRFPLHASITQATRDKLAHARALLGHAVPGGDTAEIIDRALDALIAQVEKQRFGVGARTRPARPARRRRGASERTIPMAVRTQVFRRDRGHCTFVGDTGHPCESRHGLEFDHIVPIARGGLTTADNLRLRCRTHNHVEAERTFGAAFMKAKRERAVAARAARTEPAWQQDVHAALRSLGFREKEARSALASCDLGPDASLEQRVRTALQHLAPPAARHPAPAA